MQMIDKEKVIKGLKELHGSIETMNLISDAIALVTEQEPKVLTLEEVEERMNTNDAYDSIFYAEVRTLTKTSFGVFQLNFDSEDYYVAMLLGSSFPAWYRKESYGKKMAVLVYKTYYQTKTRGEVGMTDFLKFVDGLRQSFPIHVEIYYSKIMDWCITITKKGCASEYPKSMHDGNDAILVREQGCDIELVFAQAHVHLKEWLLEHDGGY